MIWRRGAWPPGRRATIGLIVPIALPGEFLEYEAIFPEGVDIISVPLSLQKTTAEGVEALSGEALAEASKLRAADVISYTCTDGAALKGAEHDKEVIAGIEADGLFIACGAMQAAEVIEPLEKATGIPAISSSTANAWMCLKLAEIHEPILGFGRLFELPR